MAPILSRLFALLLLLLLPLTPLTLAEPAQYCRFGYWDGAVDFCMGVVNHHNTTSSADDLYLSLSVTRSSPLGWTSVATGPTMAGAVMVIVYGDPSSGNRPVVSIRTIDGHHQPKLINATTPTGGADIQVLQAEWQEAPPRNNRPRPRPRLAARHGDDEPDPKPQGAPTHIANIAVVCYSCNRWPGSPISASTSSQPWIWAWNGRQKFDSYKPNEHLKMHKHHASDGGWGGFYVDMAQATVDDKSVTGVASFLPPFKANIEKIGTSDSPIGAAGFLASLKEKPTTRAHGFLMGMAFLVLFPLGVVLMRSAKGNPFKRHWVVQLVATGLAWIGAIVGMVLSRWKMPSTTHQWIGIGIALALTVQAVLGWRHHMVFLRLRRRTWISHAHIWLGRSGLALGWVNVLSGLVLSGHAKFDVGVSAGLVALEAVCVSAWVWMAQRSAAKRQAALAQSEAHALMPTSGTDDYFALEMSDEDDTDDEDKELGKKSGPRNGDYHASRKSVDAASVKN
ncbi:hypothetical protein B0T17DRAFT_513005 [Bombardia bombarda]|uniref:Cytochrome b561 domain-containing protein n=1 Tax=Bombardia bombarda TaxID=252184 RepID=A0AA39XHW4_9PEZI|nr:hypothetical protein B0T17DRAFT_513005 [Bombardia bombarda]